VWAYRKLYPGAGSVYHAGIDLPIFWHGATPFGVLIYNDAHPMELARVLAARGAAILMGRVPMQAPRGEGIGVAGPGDERARGPGGGQRRACGGRRRRWPPG
jgi:hypothetical protein